jgi:hypothetical protein
MVKVSWLLIGPQGLHISSGTQCPNPKKNMVYGTLS